MPGLKTCVEVGGEIPHRVARHVILGWSLVSRGISPQTRPAACFLQATAAVCDHRIVRSCPWSFTRAFGASPKGCPTRGGVITGLSVKAVQAKLFLWNGLTHLRQ